MAVKKFRSVYFGGIFSLQFSKKWKNLKATTAFDLFAC